MTADEFRALGTAPYVGAHDWQTPMAERLGTTPRTVRRWASGITPVPASVARILRPGLDGSLPRDEWIIGTDMPEGCGQGQQYLVHMRYPRFVARVVSVNDQGRDRAQ